MFSNVPSSTFDFLRFARTRHCSLSEIINDGKWIEKFFKRYLHKTQHKTDSTSISIYKHIHCFFFFLFSQAIVVPLLYDRLSHYFTYRITAECPYSDAPYCDLVCFFLWINYILVKQCFPPAFRSSILLTFIAIEAKKWMKNRPRNIFILISRIRCYKKKKMQIEGRLHKNSVWSRRFHNTDSRLYSRIATNTYIYEYIYKMCIASIHKFFALPRFVPWFDLLLLVTSSNNILTTISWSDYHKKIRLLQKVEKKFVIFFSLWNKNHVAAWLYFRILQLL